MNWVMDRALPEDVPIESKMVTKSVERAQSTVEQRNAEVRKNVLKYDEVYDQQRKVIYQRRRQILERGDLKQDTKDSIDTAADVLVSTFCIQELDDTWDVEGLLADLKSFWATELVDDDITSCENLKQVRSVIAAEGLAQYEAKEERVGESVMRQAERQIMLQLIDQRWRDHLTEMSHLREGINLRAMGQRDPLTEWQREGFDLFSTMMSALEVDYVKYVMHFEVAVPETGQASEPAPSLPTAEVQATELTATHGDAPEAEAQKPRIGGRGGQPLVKDDWDRTPRNAPCPCGSGKKFKQCHG